MFGLEKTISQGFTFDLEQDLKKNPSKLQETLKLAEEKIQTLKSQLREGASGQELDHLGTLLHGYLALHKILKRISLKK
ncbi:DUF5398 family protein [Rhabdochlamydiaceae symbiont of Dictyostelium giganteum]|uniref:DUF5398 family protein n=1 Tax=Rhabdochlamydiaceae symbiont of Dictyostelium giganteum TaxID=3342349 RepID=UPI00384E708D